MEKELNKMKERKERSISSGPWTSSTINPFMIGDLLLVVPPPYVKEVHMKPSQTWRKNV